MCALAPQIQFGKWDEGPGRATPAPVVVPAAIGEVLVGYHSRTPVQTGAASYFQGAIELPLASREENVLGAPDGRLGLASVLAQATPDWITLAAYPSRKVPSLRTEIPDWIDQWEFSRFVTLATNDPSLAKRRMPGTSLPYGFLRHRLRRWDAMVNHAISGPNGPSAIRTGLTPNIAEAMVGHAVILKTLGLLSTIMQKNASTVGSSAWFYQKRGCPVSVADSLRGGEPIVDVLAIPRNANHSYWKA
jgi:hypothetical protein